MKLARTLAVTVAVAVLPAVLGVAGGDAHAASGVKRVGLQAGFAGVAGNEGTFSGYGGALSLGWGISDAFTIAANGTATSNQVAKTGGRSLVLSQALGVNYTLDIIQVVPYVGLYAALYEIGGGGMKNREVKVGGQMAIGLDWVYSRDFIFGLDIRGHVLPKDFADAPDNPSPFYITTFLKAEYTWGWF